MFVINGIKSTKPNEIANGFCNYFSIVVSTLQQISYPLTGFTWTKPLNLPICTCKSFHFGYVSVTEVTQLLKKLKCKKAAGYYDLPLGLLKDSVAVISAPLTHITNLSFWSGIFPSDWKIAKTLPLRKWCYWSIWKLPSNFSFTRNFQGCWGNRTQSVGWLFIWQQTAIEAPIWFSCEKVHWRRYS